MTRNKIFFLISFLLISVNTFADLEQGIKGHSRGDIILVKKNIQIATWCDFTKQIVNTQTGTLCAYNGNQVTEVNHEVL